MKTTNIRELKHATSTVLSWVAEGETVEITRHNQVVGVIVPPTPKNPKEARRPRFASRLKKMWGDRVLPTTGVEIVSDGRGER